MFSKKFSLLVTVFAIIGNIGCNEESHPLSASDSSLVGTWSYDTTLSSEEGGVSAMSLQFDIKQNSTYAITMEAVSEIMSIKMADTGTWIQSGSDFIRTRLSTWNTNYSTGQYEQITPSTSLDTMHIDIRNNQWYFTLEDEDIGPLTLVLTRQ